MSSNKLDTQQPVSRSLSREQVAENLNCSAKTVDRRIAAGELNAMRMGRLIRISEDELRAYKLRCRIMSAAG